MTIKAETQMQKVIFGQRKEKKEHEIAYLAEFQLNRYDRRPNKKGGNTCIMETIEQYWGLACKNLAPQNAHNLQKIADNKGLKKIKRDGEVTQVSEREQ